MTNCLNICDLEQNKHSRNWLELTEELIVSQSFVYSNCANLSGTLTGIDSP